MHRIDNSTAQSNKFGAGKSGFTGGNPATATPSTRLTPEWCDDVQENIARVIEAASIPLVKGNGDQLYNAIQGLIAASAISGLKELAYLAVGHGLESDGAGNARVKLNGATLSRDAAGLALNLAASSQWVGTQSGTEVVMADAATLTWPQVGTGADQRAAQMVSVTLGGNRSLGYPANISNGTYYSLLVIQPAAGGPYFPSFTASFTGYSGITFTTAANAIDHLVFRGRGGKLSLVSFAPNAGA